MSSRSLRALASLVLVTSVVTLAACGSGEPGSTGPVLPQVTLPAATVGAPYEKVLTATGGTPPLTYTVDQVPPGFSFYGDTGRLVGPATTAGEWTLTVSVRDAKGLQSSRGYALRVQTASDELPDGGPVTDGGTTTDGGTQPTANFKVGNWNIEWFGSTTEGPTDEALQLANAKAVIADAGPEVMGVAEIVSEEAFNSLKNGLSGYDGVLASGWPYGLTDQKVGVLYKTDSVQLVSSSVVLTECAQDFAYRPPLRVNLKVLRGSSPVDLTVMVLHMKAYADSDSYARRQAAAYCLKNYLDTSLPTQNVMVLGDWNDDVDASIYTPNASPYANFVQDPARYKFLTQALSESGARSTVSNSQFIDHQLATNELAAYYVPPTEVIKPSIVSYKATTSDHYPIFSRFNFGSAAQTRSVRLTAPNGGETLQAGKTFSITWTSSNVAQVDLTYTLDGTVWRSLASGLAASSGRYTWTVPSESSTSAKVRVADSSRTDVSDVSDGVFTLTRPVPQVFINEYLPQPNPAVPGGTTPDYDQQFVEIYNSGPTSVDLSYWTIHDAKTYSGLEAARHTFVSGTVLPAGKGYVVYSGASAVPAGAQYATYANNNGYGLRLDRGINQGGAGDAVYLVRADGTVQDSHSYQVSGVDVYQGYSFNRSPDLSATGNWSYTTPTPRTRTDGSPF